MAVPKLVLIVCTRLNLKRNRDYLGGGERKKKEKNRKNRMQIRNINFEGGKNKEP